MKHNISWKNLIYLPQTPSGEYMWLQTRHGTNEQTRSRSRARTRTRTPPTTMKSSCPLALSVKSGAVCPSGTTSCPSFATFQGSFSCRTSCMASLPRPDWGCFLPKCPDGVWWTLLLTSRCGAISERTCEVSKYCQAEDGAGNSIDEIVKQYQTKWYVPYNAHTAYLHNRIRMILVALFPPVDVAPSSLHHFILPESIQL